MKEILGWLKKVLFYQTSVYCVDFLTSVDYAGKTCHRVVRVCSIFPLKPTHWGTQILMHARGNLLKGVLSSPEGVANAANFIVL